MSEMAQRAEIGLGDEKEGFQGVFSREEKAWIGSGTTKRKVVKAVYYFACQQQDGTVELRVLSSNNLPQGEAKRLNIDEFLAGFKPEPEIYKKQTLPALREVSKNLAKGDRLRQQGQPFSAEVAFQSVLNVDAENVRGTFGLGLTYLDQGKTSEAEGVLKRIVRNVNSFDPENKHMFNEFGIKLRKNKMYDQALAYYATAYKHAKRDENLCYNIARTLLDKGDPRTAKKYLAKALALRPDFAEAAKLLLVVEKQLATGA